MACADPDRFEHALDSLDLSYFVGRCPALGPPMMLVSIAIGMVYFYPRYLL
jgi:hypothetical protein